MRPIPIPTVEPGNPSKAPVAAPTFPPTSAPPTTSTPSLSPTPIDTTTVACEMVVSGLDADAVTSDDEEALKIALARMLDGISASDIYNLVVEQYTSSRRELLTATSIVTFDIIIEISESSFADVEELSTAVETEMDEIAADSTEFIAEVQTESSSDTFDSAEVESTSTVTLTRNPTTVPTLVPTTSRSPGVEIQYEVSVVLESSSYSSASSLYSAITAETEAFVDSGGLQDELESGTSIFATADVVEDSLVTSDSYEEEVSATASPTATPVDDDDENSEEVLPEDVIIGIGVGGAVVVIGAAVIGAKMLGRKDDSNLRKSLTKDDPKAVELAPAEFPSDSPPSNDPLASNSNPLTVSAVELSLSTRQAQFTSAV